MEAIDSKKASHENRLYIRILLCAHLVIPAMCASSLMKKMYWMSNFDGIKEEDDFTSLNPETEAQLDLIFNTKLGLTGAYFALELFTFTAGVTLLVAFIIESAELMKKWMIYTIYNGFGWAIVMTMEYIFIPESGFTEKLISLVLGLVLVAASYRDVGICLKKLQSSTKVKRQLKQQ